MSWLTWSPSESESLALTWNDINWEDSSIKAYATKTNTTRVIPIAPEFLERLKTMRQKARIGYIKISADAW